jgi:hypothetical protein
MKQQRALELIRCRIKNREIIHAVSEFFVHNVKNPENNCGNNGCEKEYAAHPVFMGRTGGRAESNIIFVALSA